MVPAFTLLTCHWNEGEAPPLTGVAVKVTLLPSGTGLAEATIVRLTGRFGLTFMVTVPDVAGFPEAQLAFDVSEQLTWSLFTGV